MGFSIFEGKEQPLLELSGNEVELHLLGRLLDQFVPQCAHYSSFVGWGWAMLFRISKLFYCMQLFARSWPLFNEPPEKEESKKVVFPQPVNHLTAKGQGLWNMRKHLLNLKATLEEFSSHLAHIIIDSEAESSLVEKRNHIAYKPRGRLNLIGTLCPLAICPYHLTWGACNKPIEDLEENVTSSENGWKDGQPIATGGLCAGIDLCLFAIKTLNVLVNTFNCYRCMRESKREYWSLIKVPISRRIDSIAKQFRQIQNCIPCVSRKATIQMLCKEFAIL
eukprot:Gb_10483 [translate_table: standard]